MLTEKEQLARSRLCLPLDVESLEKAEEVVKELKDFIGMYKINYLFTAYGEKAVDMIKKYNADIFLDMKFHDIPNTVENHIKNAVKYGVDIINVHAAGGLEMMKAAVKGARIGSELYKKPLPKLVAVTILTSVDEAHYLHMFKPANPALEGIDFSKYLNMKDNKELEKEFDELLNKYGLKGVIQKQVLNLAKLTHKAGLDGIVCAANDLYAIKDKLPKDFIYITPGIHAVGSVAGSDQKRVFTPGNAVRDGSSILVAGRTILEAKGKGTTTYNDMREAAHGIFKDMAQYL